MNNNQVKKDNDTRKIFTTLVLVLTLMIFTTGATYAYFAINATNSNTVAGTAASASLNLSVSKIKPTSTGTGVMVPQESVVGTTNVLKKAIDASCIDANNNLICQVYTIVLSNAGTSSATLNGSFTLIAANMSHLKWILLAEGTGSTPSTTYTYPTITNQTEYGNLKSVTTLDTDLTLVGGSSYYYVVAVWIEETGTNQSNEDNGSFTGTISFVPNDGSLGITSTIKS